MRCRLLGAAKAPRLFGVRDVERHLKRLLPTQKLTTVSRDHKSEPSPSPTVETFLTLFIQARATPLPAPTPRREGREPPSVSGPGPLAAGRLYPYSFD